MYVQGRELHVGEIYLMKFSGSNSEQRGWRPGLVVQNNVGNKYSPNTIAYPLTSVIKKMQQPTHVLVSAKETGLKSDSVVLCENPERISKRNVGQYLTKLPNQYMERIAVASLLATSVISYLDERDLITAWRKAQSINSCESE